MRVFRNITLFLINICRGAPRSSVDRIRLPKYASEQPTDELNNNQMKNSTVLYKVLRVIPQTRKQLQFLDGLERKGADLGVN